MAVEYKRSNNDRSAGVGYVMDALSNVGNMLQPLQDTFNNYTTAKRNQAVNQATDQIFGAATLEDAKNIKQGELLGNGYLNAADKKALTTQLGKHTSALQGKHDEQVLGDALKGMDFGQAIKDYDNVTDFKNSLFDQAIANGASVATASKISDKGGLGWNSTKTEADRGAVNSIISSYDNPEILASMTPDEISARISQDIYSATGDMSLASQGGRMGGSLAKGYQSLSMTELGMEETMKTQANQQFEDRITEADRTFENTLAENELSVDDFELTNGPISDASHKQKSMKHLKGKDYDKDSFGRVNEDFAELEKEFGPLPASWMDAYIQAGDEVNMRFVPGTAAREWERNDKTKNLINLLKRYKSDTVKGIRESALDTRTKAYNQAETDLQSSVLGIRPTIWGNR